MNYQEILSIWHQIAFILIFVLFGVALLNFLLYKIELSSKKSYKDKFDVASEKEIKKYLISHIFIAGALFFFNNTLQDETVALSKIWFFIRFFVAVCVSTLYAYVAYLILQFYYPGILEKKLKIYRYTPRINPKNGNKMKLLSEDEEDAYLDEGMQAEEDLFTIDYDVWIDEQTGDTKIEKYKGFLSALKCDRCGFQTLKLDKEEIIKKPTSTSNGEILKEYYCSYCDRIKRKNVVLTSRINENSNQSALISDPLSNRSPVSLVKIQILDLNGKAREYDFPNVDQAKNFINRF